jgi:hypothetical protein
MKERNCAISAVASNTGLSRHKLAGFLAGSSALRSAELDKVLDFLDLATSPTETEQKRSHNYAVNTLQFDTISNDLVRHSLAYIADGENASGTLVAIGVREFIATTAHTLSPSLKSLVLIGHGLHPLNRDDIKIVKAGRAKGGNPDVAYIELEPGTIKTLGREAIDVGRLCDVGPGQPGRMAFLYGCPHALIKNAVNHKRREAIIGFHSFTYPNAVLAVDEWPAVPKDAVPPKRSVDLFIPYDVTEEMIVIRPVRGNRLPNPKGASGGGIWQGVGPLKGAVWHVDKVKLVAIQSSWDEQRKYIRGVQIKQWVRLIERDYPDLRPRLELQKS